MKMEQEKMVALGRGKMWLGGWQELRRKLKRFHVWWLPVIYRVSATMFALVGILMFRQILEFMDESGTTEWKATLFSAIYFFILLYWTYMESNT